MDGSGPTAKGPVARPGILKIRAHMIGAAPGRTDGDADPDRIYINSNESAFGPSPKAVAAANAAMGAAARYPETAPADLAAAIGRRFDLDPGRIVCGFGSDDLLARIARCYLAPGDELVYSANGYQKIPNYAHANDAVPVAAPDRDLTADADSLLSKVGPRTRIVMLANPDNPAGTHVDGDEVRRLHAGLPGHVLLVLDSAYAEFADADDYEDPARLAGEASNVVMTRTFSKVFGLAGLRIGWAYGAPGIVDVLGRVGITFPISVPARAAALAALADRAHFDHVLTETKRLRHWLSERLMKLGLTVYPSQTNFVLARFPGGPAAAQAAYEALAARGVVARRLAAAAFADCIRFTIGTEAEMMRTADSLAAHLGTDHD